MTSVEKALSYTLAYSAVFNFPLTKEELWQFLISEEAITRKSFEQTLKNLPSQIIYKNGLYALSGHENDIKARKSSAAELKKKLQITKRAAYYLSYIPSIRLIGISGSVAMNKAGVNDDIDFFIITKKNKLFMTRVLIQAMLEMLNLRRKRHDKIAQDKICVNLLIDETNIAWPEDRQDVYTAHEILQMKPLFERSNTYKKFVGHNSWVQEYFPNAFTKEEDIVGKAWRRKYVGLWVVCAVVMMKPLEGLAGKIQKKYMKRVQTTEIVSNNLLAFHPVDYRSKTITNLHMKLRQLGLLTNK